MVCSLQCAMVEGKKATRRQEKRDNRAKKQQLKTRGQHLKDAQKAFNRWIRVRDTGCISCGTENPNIQYCAGHYFTVGGYPELRFNEDNVHRQCNKNCNLELSGNIAAYRVRLLAKIGPERLATLEGPHKPKHYSIDEINAIKVMYSAMAKKLEKQNSEQL